MNKAFLCLSLGAVHQWDDRRPVSENTECVCHGIRKIQEIYLSMKTKAKIIKMHASFRNLIPRNVFPTQFT